MQMELICPENTLGKGYLVMVAYTYTNRRIGIVYIGEFILRLS